MKQIPAKYNLLIVIALAVLLPSGVMATSISDLQRRIDTIQRNLESSEATLGRLSAERDTLENKIAILNAEIAELQTRIQKTQLEISITERKLKETQAKLDKQKRIMFENARMLYKAGELSTIEVLASSSNFTEFINKQEYLIQVKESVNEAAREVQALKDELEKKRGQLKDQKDTLDRQKKNLQIKRVQQEQILEVTKGREAEYQRLVEHQHDQLANAERALLLAKLDRNGLLNGGGGGAGMVVQPGQVVNAGQHIGYVGTTGNSTGPHLHFAVASGSNYSYINPGSGNGSLNYGMQWPVPGFNYVVQGFIPGIHNGLDIGHPDGGQFIHGANIVAASGGRVIYSGDTRNDPSMDWQFGNLVIIEDAAGRWVFYAHLN